MSLLLSRMPFIMKSVAQADEHHQDRRTSALRALNFGWSIDTLPPLVWPDLAPLGTRHIERFSRLPQAGGATACSCSAEINGHDTVP